METKGKSELIIFWGFVFLAISFFGMIWYFKIQNDVLDGKSKKIILQTRELRLQTIATTETKKQTEQAINKIKLLSPALSNKIDTITKLTNESIKADITKIATKQGLTKSVIYVQVGSIASSSELKSKDFINKLNAIGYNIINTYDLEEGKADNSIRYFNKEDKNLSENLKNDIQKEFPDIILKAKFVSLKTKIPIGQIEIWVK